MKRNELEVVEHDFYCFINENCKLITCVDHCKAELDEFKNCYPRYIRSIYQLPVDQLAKAQDFYKKMLLAYESLLSQQNRVSKRFPANFPHILDDIKQINVWKHDAFQSKIYKPFFPAWMPISRFFKTDESTIKIAETRTQFEKLGIKTKTVNSFYKQSKAENQKDIPIYILLDTADLANYFKLSEIRMRRRSGYQYRAIYYCCGERTPKRISFGLILASGDFEVFSSNPQPERPHKRSVSEQINFDFDVQGKFVDLYPV